MKESAYVRMRNTVHPGYSKCSRCGGNWGWKEHVAHDTEADGSRGLFLFCKQCDEKVTLRERWDALDLWKADVAGCVSKERGLSEESKLAEIRKIFATEFVDFPGLNSGI